MEQFFDEEEEDIYNMEHREECAYCIKAQKSNKAHPIDKCFAKDNTMSMVDLELRKLYADIQAVGAICRVGYRNVTEKELKDRGFNISLLQHVQNRNLGKPANSDQEKEYFSQTSEGLRFQSCGCELGRVLETVIPGRERSVITGKMMFECKTNKAMRYLMILSAKPQDRINMLQYNEREYAEEQLLIVREHLGSQRNGDNGD